MNYITRLDHFRSLKDVKKAELEKLESQFEKVYTGCETLKERVEARKINKAVLDEIAGEMATNQNDIKFINLCIATCKEMIAKEAANNFIQALKDGKKNLLNVPTHYKKFKAAAAEALNDDGNGFISHQYYTMYYSTPYYSPAGNQDIYILTTSTEGGPITPAGVEKTTFYNLIPVEEIEAAVDQAIKAAEEIKQIKEAAKSRIDEIKAANNTCNAIVNILDK